VSLDILHFLLLAILKPTYGLSIAYGIKPIKETQCNVSPYKLSSITKTTWGLHVLSDVFTSRSFIIIFVVVR
jgi:hypothetical protein